MDAGAGEEEADVGGEGGRPGDTGAQVATKSLADLREDQRVGDLVLRGETEGYGGGAGAPEVVLADLGVLTGDPGGPLEDLELGAAAARALAATPL